jgi:hypothetical protein
MEPLNGCAAVAVTVVDSRSFTIGDTSAYPPHSVGGIVHQVKRPARVSFRRCGTVRRHGVAAVMRLRCGAACGCSSFRESLSRPQFACPDCIKEHLLPAVHAAFQSAHDFHVRCGVVRRTYSDIFMAPLSTVTLGCAGCEWSLSLTRLRSACRGRRAANGRAAMPTLG